MNFPTITRYNWMCCSIILVFLALSSPEPLQAQENQKERITIQVKNQPIQKVFDDLSKQTGLKFFYGEAIANRNVQVNLKFKNAPVNSVLNEITRQANLYFKRENNTIAVSLGNAGNASVPVTQDRKVTGIITDERGETIIGANVFKDFFAGIRDIVGGRAGSYESVLREAKETALKEMSDHAARMGANAVIAVDLDYETVGGSGSMLMVTAAGTAVRYQ